MKSSQETAVWRTLKRQLPVFEEMVKFSMQLGYMLALFRVPFLKYSLKATVLK